MVDVKLEDQYEQFAPFYELIFSDWEAMMRDQARIIDEIIQNYWPGEKTLLDLSCGVGTQSIGLAALGYEVTGIDLTRGMIRRATQEASNRCLPIRFLHGDMRELTKLELGQY